ncbi:MAG: PAS domain-containing protein, partial [Bryobacterales bacterium]|nr:PAS domain-containing protein [Bryobacterales bacterium]
MASKIDPAGEMSGSSKARESTSTFNHQRRTRSLSPEIEHHRLRILYELLYDLTKTHSLEDVYESAISALLAGTDAGRASIRIFDDDGILRFKAWRDLSSDFREALTSYVPWPKGAVDALPVLKPGVGRDKDLAPFRDALACEDVSGMGIIPLISQNGVFGTFDLLYRQPHSFSDNEVIVAQAIAYHISSATEKKKAAIQLAEVARRREAILESTNVSIVVKDASGRYTLVNRRFRRLLHISKQQVAGKTDYDFFPRDVADRLRANDERVFHEGQIIEFEEEIPYDDGIHTYISEKIPLRSAEGQIVAVCTIAKDITDQKKADTALRRANRSLEQFAYSVSHDLREPTRMMVAFTQLLQKCCGPRLDAQANKYMEFIVGGALQMQNLISGLFDFLESGNIP